MLYIQLEQPGVAKKIYTPVQISLDSVYTTGL